MMSSRELLHYLACSLAIFPFDGALKKRREGEVGAESECNDELD